MAKADQPVGLNDEQPATTNLRDAAKLAGLADLCGSVSSTPSRPEVFFVLPADEALKVDSPNYVARLHEIQSGERNRDRGCPALLGNPSLGSPDAIPARVTVSSAPVRALFLRDQRIALSAERIYLKHVRITPVVRGVDDDFEIVVQFLGHITPQLGRDDPFWVRVEARDTEIDLVPVVQGADLGFFSGCLSFKWLPLQKLGNRRGLLPCGIVKRSVQFRSSLNSACARGSERLLGSQLPLFGLCIRL